MTFRFVFFTTIILLFASSCSKECIEGDGKLSAEIREVEAYDKIANTSPFNVLLSKGAVFGGSLQGDSNIVALTQLKVSGNELEIDTENFCSSTLNLRVDLVVPNITKITNEGIGSINGTTDFSDLEIINSGTGDIELKGQSLSNLEINNEGTGSILLYGLGAQDLKVINSGTGDVFIFVSDKLDVTISGTGNVYYKGRPEITSDISGIGQLIDDN